MTLPEPTPYNSLGFDMKGIRPQGTCPKCHKKFVFSPRGGFICPKHQTVPKRFIIDIYFKGERIRRGTDLSGNTLRTYADALVLYRLAQDEKQRKRFDPKKWKSKLKIDYLFETLLDKWLADKENLLEEKKRSASYVSELPTYCNRFFIPCYQIQDVREILNLDDFTTFLRHYRTDKNTPISLKYKKNLTDCLKSFFRWLLKKRYIDILPDFPDPIDVPEHQPQTLTRETRMALLEHIPPEHQPIFAWLFVQGCRPGEARALMWDCIKDGVEPNDTVEYKRTFSNNVLQEHTKTKRIRENYIFPESRAILPDRGHPLSFVFVHGVQAKRPYSKPFLNKIYRKALASYNQENGTDLNIELYEATKHSFGTEWVNSDTGITTYHLKEWFGHTSEKMTEKYAKLRIVDVFRKVEKIAHIEQATTRLYKNRQ